MSLKNEVTILAKKIIQKSSRDRFFITGVQVKDFFKSTNSLTNNLITNLYYILLLLFIAQGINGVEPASFYCRVQTGRQTYNTANNYSI
jgi:hypothetical protein